MKHQRKDRGSIIEIKNEVSEEYAERITRLKKVLINSRLSKNNIQHVESLLLDAGADYYKILREDAEDIRHYTQYDLIWKYVGLHEDFIVYIEFD